MAAATEKRNELLDVARLSMVACRRHMQSYSCPKSPHRFTQPQLMTCLVLKTYLKRTYRGIVDLLRASDGLRAAVGLDARVPAHTTLKEFERRAVTPELLDGVVGETLALLAEHGLLVEEVAVDSTGVEASGASAHFVARSGRARGRYVKLSLAVACGSVTLAAAVASFGPGNDLAEAPAALWRAAGRCRPAFVYADRGYDAEWFHRFCRDGWGPLSYVPPVVRTRDGSVRTEYRGRCARLRPAGAGRRWHAESFISGMKRTCGSAVAARGERSMLNEALLKAVAYAIRR